MRVAHMSRDEVMERLEQLGWEPGANVAYMLLEKKSILHELEENVTKSQMNDNPNVCAGLSQKNKTELRDVCKAFGIPLSGHETKPQLTTKIKEVQAEREPLRQTTLDFGRHRGKMHKRVCAHDKQHCEWMVLTVMEDGATVSPQLKQFASHVEQSRELTTTEVAQSNNEAGPGGRTGRLYETSGTSASDAFHNGRRQQSPVQLEDDECAATSDAAEEWKTTLHGRG